MMDLNEISHFGNILLKANRMYMFVFVGKENKRDLFANVSFLK